MNLRLKLFGFFSFLRMISFTGFAIGILTSCLFETTSNPYYGAHSLSYQVIVAAKGQSHCEIEIEINQWPQGEGKIFQLPYYYTDNPALPVPGIASSAIMAFDSQGRKLQVKDTILEGSNLQGRYIVLPEAAVRISYPVDLDPKDPNRFGIPMPRLKDGIDLFDGAYFFVLPVIGDDISSQWRQPLQIELEFLPATDRILVGTETKLNLKTNYELMFVRAAYDPIEVSTITLGNRQVTTYGTSSDSMNFPAFQTLFAKCLTLVEDSLLPLPISHYYVGETPVFWGIEGTGGYWFRQEAQTLAMVHVHELVHTVVGIYNADRQDPWYKEGLTEYIGYILALQGGLTPEINFTNEILHPLDSIIAVKKYPLSSPIIRNNLFSPLDSNYLDKPNPENFLSLVYTKGAQASMIIDRYIWENSQKKSSVFTMVRDLNLRFTPSFSREDLVTLIVKYTHRSNSEVSGFLQSLLDQPGYFSQDSLTNTYMALKSNGRFLPGISITIPSAKTSNKFIQPFSTRSLRKY